MSNAEIRGRFVWHELMTTDTDAAIDFYSHVVPWKTQDSGMPSYTLWMSGKFRAGGLMALPEDGAPGTPPHWLVYVGTPDVDATVESAEKLGGKVLKPGADIPNVGRFAVLSDPQGATFAVYTPAPGSGDEVPPGGGVGDFTWHELATTDLEGALEFYSELFGWSKGEAHDMGGEMGTYQLISLDGQNIGGVYKARDNSTPPSWLSYARVPDVTKAANAVKANGGRIVQGPMEVPDGSWIVMMHDPQGGAFAVVEEPKAAKGGSAAEKATAAPKKPAKKTPAKKAAAKKAPAKKAAAAAAKGAPAKTAPAKKTAAKKGAAKKGAAKKSAAKKAAKKLPMRAAAKKSAIAKRGSAPKKATKAKRKK